MRNHSTSIAAALLLMAGCLGDFEVDSGGSGGEISGGTAEAMFANMHTQLNQECGIACHANPAITDAPQYQSLESAEANMNRILGYTSAVDGSPIVGNSPANSRLYVYGVHTGPALTTELAGEVEAWIIALAEERGLDSEEGGGGEPIPPSEPKTLVQALTKFSECMAYTDFEATNFQNLANQNTNEGQCLACHAYGLGGAPEFFTGQKNMPYLLKFVSGTVNTNGSFDDLVAARRYEEKRGDGGHPNYLMAADRIESMNQFFDLTYNRYRASIDTATPCVPDLPPPPQ
jgi:hypothetical protein